MTCSTVPVATQQNLSINLSIAQLVERGTVIERLLSLGQLFESAWGETFLTVFHRVGRTRSESGRTGSNLNFFVPLDFDVKAAGWTWSTSGMTLHVALFWCCYYCWV